MYGHIAQLAQAEKEGIEAAGGTADLYQYVKLLFLIILSDILDRVAETLPEEVLTKMHAPAKKDIPIVTPETLEQYDGFLLGIPTRYGSLPAQWKTFWDATGKQWQTGGYFGKYAGVFVSTGGLGGGQESTAFAALSTFAHHSIIYVSKPVHH